jgi:four helix bundle protein
MVIKSYQDLVAWQKGMDLVELVYHVSARFPVEERFGLTSQVRRAAVSIPSNIAEGQARSSRDFLRFLDYSKGSLAETETQILVGERLKFITSQESQTVLTLSTEVGRIVSGLIKSIPTDH